MADSATAQLKENADKITNMTFAGMKSHRVKKRGGVRNTRDIGQFKWKQFFKKVPQPVRRKLVAKLEKKVGPSIARSIIAGGYSPSATARKVIKDFFEEK